jgi:DNA-binding NarL/FixJ family response regulator
MIRIVIADDHMIVRQGLRQILSHQPDFAVIGEAANYAEVMQLVRREPPDVLVLDISMPGKSGIDTLKQVKDEAPRVAVLMLSSHPEDLYALRALKAGAAGYVNKIAAAEQLIMAIRTAAKGRKYITPELAELLADGFTHPGDGAPHESLSDRELQTLRMIAAGKPLAAIATELSLSPKTVSAYRARVLAKLNVGSNAELTRYALEHGLVE